MTNAQRTELLRPLDTLGSLEPLKPGTTGHGLSSQPIRKLPAHKP